MPKGIKGFQKNNDLGEGRIEGSKNEKTLARLKMYQDELDAIQEAMALKDKKTLEYRILVDAADKIQKQVQLLSGDPTERHEISGVEITTRK